MCSYLYRVFKGPRQPYYNPICLFFMFVKKYFPQQLYYFQHNSACETRITENGIPPEPNLCKLDILD